jgi:hypothetical protein
MSLILQPRDEKIILNLAPYGFFSLNQLSVLFFENNCETARKCVRRLSSANLLQSTKVPGSAIRLVHLSRRSANALRLNGFPSSEQPKPGVGLAHSLAVRDFLAALQTNSRQREVAVEFEIASNHLYFDAGHGTLRPDGFLSITQEGNHKEFFVEIDCGTETHGRLLEKVESYRKILRNGSYARFRSASVERVAPFQVLFVFFAASRAHRFLGELDKLGVRRFVLAGTMKDVSPDPFGPVWEIAEGINIGLERRLQTLLDG